MSTRSEKRFAKDVEKLVETREQYLELGKLSLKSGEGKLVIVVSTSPDKRDTDHTPAEQKKIFLEEGERLQALRAPKHQDTVMRPRAFSEDIRMDMNDPEVTDMIFIGHGSIGNFWTDGRKRNFDWLDVAKNARGILHNSAHLKQGAIEQRMCGDFPMETVPFGTAIVSDLRNLHAATGMRIDVDHPSEDLFKPVYAANDDLAIQIADLNHTFKHQNKDKKE